MILQPFPDGVTEMGYPVAGDRECAEEILPHFIRINELVPEQCRIEEDYFGHVCIVVQKMEFS
jgi:hypothetical protein